MGNTIKFCLWKNTEMKRKHVDSEQWFRTAEELLKSYLEPRFTPVIPALRMLQQEDW